MNPETLQQALARTATALGGGTSAEALLVRWEAGTADPGDPLRRTTLARELLERQAPDGSWEGRLLRTAEALLLLRELAAPAAGQEPVVAAQRAVAWIQARRGGAGRYGAGCAPDRHRAGLCRHFLGGFFAPDPAEPDVRAGEDEDTPEAWLRLQAGAVVRGDEAIAFAASAVALQALLRWEVRRSRDVELHLDGLRLMLRLRAENSPLALASTAAVCGLSALLEAADRDEWRQAAEATLAWLARRQRADGTWADNDTFQMLELLLEAQRRGLGGAAVDRALARGARLLAISQQADGSWGREAGDRRTLVGWRVLRRVGAAATTSS
jgi:hypothetical protein